VRISSDVRDALACRDLIERYFALEVSVINSRQAKAYRTFSQVKLDPRSDVLSNRLLK